MTICSFYKLTKMMVIYLIYHHGLSFKDGSLSLRVETNELFSLANPVLISNIANLSTGH